MSVRVHPASDALESVAFCVSQRGIRDIHGDGDPPGDSPVTRRGKSAEYYSVDQAVDSDPKLVDKA